MGDLVSYVVLGTTRGLIYGILALGLVLIYKGTRVLNLAQPFFGLLGAFVCWWFTAEAKFLPFTESTRPRFLVALVLTLAVVGVQAMGLERFLFRKLRRVPRLVTLVATLAIGQGVLGLVVVLFERNQDQAEQLRIIPTVVRGIVEVGDVNLTGGDLQVLAIVPLVALELALFFRLSRFGVAIRAAAENSDSARLLGISVDRVASFSWISGLMLSALAGILLASSQGTLAISTLSTGFLVRALAAALIGGLTSLPGALVGGLVVGIGEATISGVFRGTVGAADVVFFLGVVVMLILRPQGLFGEREDTEDKVAFVPALRELPERFATSVYAVALRRIGGVTLVAFALAVSLATGSATNGTLTLISVGAMVGVSLTVLMGYTGQISLGHWALVGVGAFAAANLHGRLGVPFLLTLPLVVVIGMVVSLLIGLPALRIKGLYLAVITLTFSYAAELYVFRSELVGGGQTGQPMNIPAYGAFDLDAPSNRPLFAFSLVMLLASIWVARNLLGSRTGRTFLALRENEKAAATLGISLTTARLTAFAISGGIAALAGVVFALRVGTVNATDFPTETSLVLVLMVMIGGLGALSGSFLGAFVVFGLPFLFKFDNAWIIPIGTGILSIEVIVRTRGGLAGLVQRGRGGIIRGLVELEEGDPASDTPGATLGGPCARMIRAESLARSFGGIEAVTDVTFHVDPGEVVGFLGPNGAGKTTTIRMLLGLLRPSSGRAQLDRPVGYLPESFAGYDALSVESYLRFWCRAKDLDPVVSIPAATSAGDLDDLVKRPIRRLSKGQRQRVGLAQAVLGAPSSLVLDEPTIGLDPAQVVDARAVMRGAADDGAAVLFSTHLLAEAAAVCDRIVIVVGGKVVAEEQPGSTAELEDRFLRLVGAAALDTHISERAGPAGDGPAEGSKA